MPVLSPEEIQTDHERIQRHLDELLGSDSFVNAPLQARALRAILAAQFESKRLTGRLLAREVYGKDDDDYVRAIRQVIREIRLKLPRSYGEASESAYRLEMAAASYVLEISRSDPLETVETDSGNRVAPVSPAPSWATRKGRQLVFAALLVVGLAAVFVLLSPILFVSDAAGPAWPASILVDAGGIQVRDESGARLESWEQRIQEIAWGRFDDTSSLPLDFRIRGAVLERWGAHPLIVVASCVPEVVNSCTLFAIGAEGNVLDELSLPVWPDQSPPPEELHEVDGETFESVFYVSSMLPAELDGEPDDQELILAYWGTSHFPTQILALDLDRGEWRTLLDFWNPGWAHASRCDDLDGDGADEVLVYGQNNSLPGAVLTILPSTARFRGIRGRGAQGNRHTVLQETVEYPVVGKTLWFPKSHLSEPGYGWLRAKTTSVEWNPETRSFILGVGDGRINPYDPEYLLRMEFKVSLAELAVQVRFLDHDVYLGELMDRIRRGKLDDGWEILETSRLDGYGEEIASAVRFWDGNDPTAAWRPLERRDLAELFMP